MLADDNHKDAAQANWSGITTRDDTLQQVLVSEASGSSPVLSSSPVKFSLPNESPEATSSSRRLSSQSPNNFTFLQPVQDIHESDQGFQFGPQHYSTPIRRGEDVSRLPGLTLDQYNRIVPENRRIRKPDFLVEYDDKVRIIVEDKIKLAHVAIDQLVGYLKQFTKDHLDSDVPTPLGLCYVLMNNELKVAVLRESETRRGEIVGVGSEDAPANQFFNSLVWRSPAGQDVTNILLGVINECKAT